MDKLRVLSQLLRPWAYLTIKADGKFVFDWAVPVFLSIFSVGLIFLARDHVSIFGESGLVAIINSLVQTLPGFFVAALAAVASFNGEGLDNLLPKPSPTLREVVRGQVSDIPLTRRRFLCSLFAFLTVQSLFISLVGIFCVSLSVWVYGFLSNEIREFVAFLGLFFYTFVFWQLISVTLMGLYYLGYRIHLPG